MPTLEVAIETLADAQAAQNGGADSVEISRDLAHDGLTPSLDVVGQIRDAVTIDVHVIIRPHDEGFVYTKQQLETMLRDTEAMLKIGVTGIVFGAHTPAGTLDVSMIRQIAQAAHGVRFTLHRALDSAKSPETALHDLTNVVDRLLTSGPAANAWDGRVGLKAWQQTFGAHYDIIAAGSIRVEMLPELSNFTGVAGIHVGSAARMNGIVNAEKVAELRERLT